MCICTYYVLGLQRIFAPFDYLGIQALKYIFTVWYTYKHTNMHMAVLAARNSQLKATRTYICLESTHYRILDYLDI